ncbi:MAG: M23 family metallopeptidase [Saprospiraceae bacterium]|nr:M23 family metallopeptidase [Saprospiraceae bacterium]MBK8485626.1 M23 family metallopeptidase [Saprospiraceae bacterium]MBK9720102.1 M23 family metallopeptidase [Saprospiraceae bacterium]MBK9723163.1 M23 family metallopeptidase [Saprospiraceae bacterium]MBK9727095.1 M23 family metallopeptidase [Saprospiraceae bacterium]
MEKQFLFIIRNEESFEETASYRLTLQNIYILASTIVFILGLFLFLLIAFTPLKRYVPGYGDIRSQGDFIKLEQKVTKLEEELQARETYISSVKRILTGNPETSADVTKNIQIKQERPDPMPKVKEDSLLRAEFEANQAMENRSKSAIQTPSFQQTKSNFKSSDSESFKDLQFTSPIRGPLGAAYNLEKGHLGVDIMAAKNTPIKSMLAGSVIQSDWSIENGHTIAIQHGNNLVSIYKHNSALLKKTGARVKAGEAIAIIGNTGTLTNGPHLHFELWYKGRPVNPTDFIRF